MGLPWGMDTETCMRSICPTAVPFLALTAFVGHACALRRHSVCERFWVGSINTPRCFRTVIELESRTEDVIVQRAVVSSSCSGEVGTVFPFEHLCSIRIYDKLACASIKFEFERIIPL